MSTKIEKQCPEGFLPRLAMDIYNTRSEKDLWDKFVVDYQEEIEALFFEYLEDVARKEAVEKYPVLKMDVADTDLPRKIKDTLLKPPYPITKVEWLVRYTPQMLKDISGIGPKAVETITEFFAKYGIDIS